MWRVCGVSTVLAQDHSYSDSCSLHMIQKTPFIPMLMIVVLQCSDGALKAVDDMHLRHHSEWPNYIRNVLHVRCSCNSSRSHNGKCTVCWCDASAPTRPQSCVCPTHVREEQCTHVARAWRMRPGKRRVIAE